MKTKLRKIPYRLLREGRTGMPALYGIGVAVSLFLTTGTLFSSSRSVEISWALKQLRSTTRGGERVLQVGDVLLKRALPEYEVEVVDIEADEDPVPGLKVHKTDIREISLPVDYFDAAVSVSTLEHIGIWGPKFADGDRLAVDKIHQALKPGGWLIFTIPFGKPTILDAINTRIYDKERLDFMIGDAFEIVEESFVVWDRFRWRTMNYQTAEKVDLLKTEPIMVPGLALAKLRKGEMTQ